MPVSLCFHPECPLKQITYETIKKFCFFIRHCKLCVSCSSLKGIVSNTCVYFILIQCLSIYKNRKRIFIYFYIVTETKCTKNTCPLTPAPFPLWFTKKGVKRIYNCTFNVSPLTGNLVGLSFDGDSSIKRFF